MEQGNTPIYKHIKLLSHYSRNISNNEFDIPSIIFERFAYLKWTPKAYMLKSPPFPLNISRSLCCFESLNSYFESLNSYFQSLNSYFQSLNSYFQSLNSYFKTVADTGGGGGGREGGGRGGLQKQTPVLIQCHFFED